MYMDEGEQLFENIVTEIFSPLYAFVAALAVVYFLYGATRFIIDLNNPEKKNTGKEHLLWGTIGLVIIFSVGGILSLMNDTLGGMFSF